MKYAFFWIPARYGEAEADALNRFLATQRVVTATKEFAMRGGEPGWAFAVEALVETAPKAPARSKPKIDYKEALPAEEFAVFARLREWRKAVAEREGLPAYAVLTNEQLAELARKRPLSKGTLSDMEGIGPARIQKYGEALLEQLGAHKAADDKGEGGK